MWWYLLGMNRIHSGQNSNVRAIHVTRHFLVFLYSYLTYTNNRPLSLYTQKLIVSFCLHQHPYLGHSRVDRCYQMVKLWYFFFHQILEVQYINILFFNILGWEGIAIINDDVAAQNQGLLSTLDHRNAGISFISQHL